MSKDYAEKMHQRSSSVKADGEQEQEGGRMMAPPPFQLFANPAEPPQSPRDTMKPDDAVQGVALKDANGISGANHQPLQRKVKIPERRYHVEDVQAELLARKDQYKLGDLSGNNIKQYVNEWVKKAIDSGRRFSSKITTTALSIASSYIAENTPEALGWHVPKNKDVLKKVNGKDYEFHNDENGCVDFMKPLHGKDKCPTAPFPWDIFIHDPTNQAKLLNTPNKKLKSGNRSQHFKEANIIRENTWYPQNGSSSPPGYTWHHHEDLGRMQLIDRDVHAAFSHKGGFAIWGS